MALMLLGYNLENLRKCTHFPQGMIATIKESLGLPHEVHEAQVSPAMLHFKPFTALRKRVEAAAGQTLWPPSHYVTMV